MIEKLTVSILAATLLAGCFAFEFPPQQQTTQQTTRRPPLRARLGRSFRATGCVGEVLLLRTQTRGFLKTRSV
jgi:hypothetical protein